jgi:16S rRNA (cytidine1402-2'-O)-methyltransferase
LEDGLVQVQLLVSDGMRLKEASTQVAEETGLSKRELYQAALAAK